MSPIRSTKTFPTLWVAALSFAAAGASAGATNVASPSSYDVTRPLADAPIASQTTQIAIRAARQALLNTGLMMVQRNSKGKLTLSQTGTVDFGPTSLGATSTQELQLVNTGRRALRVKVNKPAQPFAIVNIANEFVLQPGEENAVNAGLDFSPEQAGPASDTVKFTTNGKVKTVKLKLKGTGVQ